MFLTASAMTAALAQPRQVSHVGDGGSSSSSSSSNDELETAANALLDAVSSKGCGSESNDSNYSGSVTPKKKKTVVVVSPKTSGRKHLQEQNALEALAALASKEHSFDQPTDALTSSSSSSSTNGDDGNMPPPAARPIRRPRSASNPEGMEKWDSLLQSGNRRHFVLPASILEEELAEATAAIQKRKRQDSLSIEQQLDGNDDDEIQVKPKVSRKRAGRRSVAQSIPEDEALGNGSMKVDTDTADSDASSEVDEKDLSPTELLRRARAKLLEDLSEGGAPGDKGALTLPHSLDKYKELYNKNGRIGIYTPSERAAVIARFNGKRSRRVWNKKIRYNCRKSLADRRLRIKGRFVKRSEQEMLAKELEKKAKEEKTGDDEDMPDVNDPDADFSPTEDQPYRRLRRHTIT